MYSGLLYCADCGEKLYYSSTNNYKQDQAYFFCSGYRRNSDVCSAHYIRERVVGQLVLESLQRLMGYVQVYEQKFVQEQMERFSLQKKFVSEQLRLRQTKLYLKPAVGFLSGHVALFPEPVQGNMGLTAFLSKLPVCQSAHRQMALPVGGHIGVAGGIPGAYIDLLTRRHLAADH